MLPRWRFGKEALEGANGKVSLPLLASVSECLVLHPQACRVEVDCFGYVFACEDDVVKGFDGERRHFGEVIVRCTSLPYVMGDGG